MRKMTLLFAVFALMSANMATADEGHLMLPGALATCTNPNQLCVIDQPGSFKITQNWTGTSAGAIRIESDDVDLDLNGFTVTVPSGAGFGIATDAGPLGVRRNIRVHNGVVEATPVDQPSVTLLDFAPALNVRVEDLKALNGHLRFDRVSNVAVRRVQVHQIGGGEACLALIGTSSNPISGVVEDSEFYPCAAAGVLAVEATALTIRNNQLSDMLSGIAMQTCRGCIVEGNSISARLEMPRLTYGIVVSDFSDSIVRNNTARGASTQGIHLGGSFPPFVTGLQSNRNIVSGNNTSSNATGLWIDGVLNHIEGNVSNSNAAKGIVLEGNDNAYRANMARGNGSGTNLDIVGTGNLSNGDNFVGNASQQ